MRGSCNLSVLRFYESITSKLSLIGQACRTIFSHHDVAAMPCHVSQPAGEGRCRPTAVGHCHSVVGRCCPAATGSCPAVVGRCPPPLVVALWSLPAAVGRCPLVVARRSGRRHSSLSPSRLLIMSASCLSACSRLSTWEMMRLSICQRGNSQGRSRVPVCALLTCIRA